MTKTDKFLTALQSGKRITIKQALHRYGFASRNSFTGNVSRLRDAGFAIEGAWSRDSKGRESYKYFIAS
jgi:hypothetical protein